MKRLLSVLLALVLVFSLVACGVKEEEPRQEENKPENSEQKPAEDKKDEPMEEEEDRKEAESGQEQEEETDHMRLVPEGETATITIGLRQSANCENYDTNDYTLWLEEQTGVNLEFVYFSGDHEEGNTQLAMMIAGGQELPDIIWNFTKLGTTRFQEFGRDGYFLDLREYFDEYAYWWNIDFENVLDTDKSSIFGLVADPLDGAIYAFPGYQSNGSSADSRANHVYINQNWLDAIGKEAPANVDELYEVLKLFASEDPNGNGEKDEIPMVSHEGLRGSILEYIINAFVYCNGDYFFNATDGKLWTPYNTNEYREALKYLNKLYEEGLLSQQTFTLSSDAEMTAIWTPSTGTAIAGVVAAHATLCTEDGNEVLFEYEPAPVLADETGLGGYAPTMASTFQYGAAITCDADDPVLCFKLLDFMGSHENGSHMRQRYGVYGEHWEYAEEGELNMSGTQAFYRSIDPGVYGSQNNTNWHFCYGFFHTHLLSSVFEDDGSYKTEKSKLVNRMIETQAQAGTPDEVVYNMVYTVEEKEVISEITTVLNDCITQARAEFITGVRDISDDAEWQNYLESLDKQGLQEYLEVSQTAYTRMNG